MSKIDEPKAMERAPIAEARMIFEAVASEIALRCIFLLYYIRAREGHVSSSEGEDGTDIADGVLCAVEDFGSAAVITYVYEPHLGIFRRT